MQEGLKQLKLQQNMLKEQECNSSFSQMWKNFCELDFSFFYDLLQQDHTQMV